MYSIFTTENVIDKYIKLKHLEAQRVQGNRLLDDMTAFIQG